MRIEKINENKIKVLIDDNEAKEWNISFKNISENTPEVQEMFWTAIRMAEENADFSVDGAKLFVEAVRNPAADDSGFGMMITRVCSDDELSCAINNCGYKGRIRRARLSYKRKSGGKKYIYCFKDFDNVCAAAGEIYSLYTGFSALYKCGEKFYLYLIPENSALFEDTERTITEFGIKSKNGQYMHGHLNEYGELMISKNAIDVLAKYFCEC